MNVSEDRLQDVGYPQILKGTEMIMARIFGASESLYVTDTYQFDDYSKYDSSAFNEPAKAKRRKEVFPDDCRKAFEMGARLTQKPPL